jgi:hypothetical protein
LSGNNSVQVLRADVETWMLPCKSGEEFDEVIALNQVFKDSERCGAFQNRIRR